jgi:hypothetical protein
MRDTIDMAREAGLHIATDVHWMPIIGLAYAEKLIELARADQDEKYKWDIHSCGPTCTKAVCVAIREAVEAEREACAKVCDDIFCTTDAGRVVCTNLAAAIRARGKA